MWTFLWQSCTLLPLYTIAVAEKKELKEMLPIHRGVGETKQLNIGSKSVYPSKGWSISLKTLLNLVFVVPRTEWWSHRSVLVLSTSGWSSPHRHCPEWTPEARPRALWETITGTSLKTGTGTVVIVVIIWGRNKFPKSIPWIHIMCIFVKLKCRQ